jgi:subtilisin family serine protease
VFDEAVQAARIERLLARHRDAVVAEPVRGRPTLLRGGQILVAHRDMPAVGSLVRRWFDATDDGPGVARVRLRARAGVDVCELAAELHGHHGLAVAPNHLVHGQPMWWTGPAGRPRPAAPPPPPAPAAPGARPVTVAVLDTGMSPHPWYAAADWYAAQRAEVTEVLDADLDYTLDAQAGHGTFIAGVVLRHAPGARIRARRVIGGDGVGDELGVLRALAWLAGTPADVVNLSMGCHTYDDRPSPLVARAVTALARRAVVVACAGNHASDRPFWPAALKQVIAVAALDGDERAWFSDHGWWVDASAPGTGITSCFVSFDGPRPPVRGIDPDAFAGYATWSGTSFAAPAVAGMVAALSAAEGVSARVAAARLLDPAGRRVTPDLGVIFAT